MFGPMGEFMEEFGMDDDQKKRRQKRKMKEKGLPIRTVPMTPGVLEACKKRDERHKPWMKEFTALMLKLMRMKDEYEELTDEVWSRVHAEMGLPSAKFNMTYRTETQEIEINEDIAEDREEEIRSALERLEQE